MIITIIVDIIIKMKIVLASPYPFTEEPGGVKDFILGLKKALQKKNCEVKIIAPGSTDALKKGLIDFVLGMDFKIVTDQTGFRASLSRKTTADKILREVKPDIIVINEPFVPSVGHTLISSLTRIKDEKRPVVVGQFHANREDLNWPLKTVEFVFRHLVRRPTLNGKKILGLSSGFVSTINNNLDGRIAVSQATKNFWQKKFPGDYKVIYNGIDTDELIPNGVKIDNWVNPTSPRLCGTRVILFAGRHDPRKGIGDLIMAIKILAQEGNSNIRLKIAGKGEITGFLQGMVRKLNLQKYIHFVGILPRRELVKAYKAADLVVVPSTGGEGFNRIIIEARSCGTMVVCTDIGGQNEAIGKDLSSFMAKRKNPHDLARQILAVLNLPEAKKQEIMRRGRLEVKALFGWDKIASEHRNYYKKMIKDKLRE